jgi:hypothetical protein
MTTFSIQRVSLLAVLVSFLKSIFRRIGSGVQAIQEHNAPEHLNKLAQPRIIQKNRAKGWREYIPSRFVKWIIVNSGPNRKQRRDEAKAYRHYLRHLARRQQRLEAQRSYKEFRRVRSPTGSIFLRKENSFAH